MNVSALTSFGGQSDSAVPVLQATNGGTIQDSLLTSLSDVNLTLDGTGTIATSQFTSFVNGTINLSGGAPTLTNLSNISGSNVDVSGGTLSLPDVTTYSNYTADLTLQATGAGNTFALSNLAR